MTVEGLTLNKIFRFWLPLALTWLLMSVEGPLIVSIISRLAEPKYNLAAHGIAFSFALIIEAPIIMIMSASTALVKNNQTFLKLRDFTYFANGAITVIMLIFIIPDIFYYITENLMELPHEVATLTHYATIILLPWPGAIGYRRFYQGLLISDNKTVKVTQGTIIRLFSMGFTAFGLYLFSDFDGVIVGASALSAGVTSEGIASKIMARDIEKRLRFNNDLTETISYRGIMSFYYPLALTSLLSLGVYPMVTFFMGHSRLSIESLAVLPVVNSLVFIFRAMGLSYQEVGIALMGKNFSNYKQLRNFAWLMGGAVIIGLSLITFTPLAEIWFVDISGLTPELSSLAMTTLVFVTILPALTVLISFQRSVLVYARRTSPITFATGMEVIGILAVLFISVNYFDMIGAYAAALAYMIGRVCANLYLIRPYLKALKIYDTKL